MLNKAKYVWVKIRYCSLKLPIPIKIITTLKFGKNQVSGTMYVRAMTKNCGRKIIAVLVIRPEACSKRKQSAYLHEVLQKSISN